MEKSMDTHISRHGCPRFSREFGFYKTESPFLVKETYMEK